MQRAGGSLQGSRTKLETGREGEGAGTEREKPRRRERIEYSALRTKIYLIALSEYIGRHDTDLVEAKPLLQNPARLLAIRDLDLVEHPGLIPEPAVAPVPVL